MKEEVDSISASFCAAKWLQVTIDLLHGTTHSCHHPERHSISLEEITKRPSALHNTGRKKKARKQMLEGIRPKECEYCWIIEDLPGDQTSDRYLKSLDTWARPHLDKLAQAPWDVDIGPTYLEVMFDKTCNLACSYCFAEVSSSIEKEISEFGPFPVFDSAHRVGKHKPNWKEGKNPFVKAFWKWLPEIYGDLKFLRVTGGEPFLTPSTLELIEYIKKKPNKEITFSINSNFSLPESIIKSFALKSNQLITEECVGQFEVYASIDTYGVQADYIRFGLSYNKFIKNVGLFLSISPKTKLVLMVNFNILSIESFNDLLVDILHLKRKFSTVLIDTSYLKSPGYLRANMATDDLTKELDSVEKFIEKNRTDSYTDGFSDYEIKKIFRVFEWIRCGASQGELDINRADFVSFIKEYDKRKSLSFLKTFKKMRPFYEECLLSRVALINV